MSKVPVRKSVGMFEIVIALLVSVPAFLAGILVGYRATRKGFEVRVSGAKAHAFQLASLLDERQSPKTKLMVEYALDRFEDGLR